jgi:hypothetical protein
MSFAISSTMSIRARLVPYRSIVRVAHARATAAGLLSLATCRLAGELFADRLLEELAHRTPRSTPAILSAFNSDAGTRVES